ncbi:MAG: hypothetical protein ABIP06_01455 [Pyrinomonadaceae bacterium]
MGIKPEIIEGKRGEFTVRVGDEVVAQKGWIMFPSDEKIIESVKAAL